MCSLVWPVLLVLILSSCRTGLCSPSTRIGTSRTPVRVRLSGGEDSPLGAGAPPMLEILDLMFWAAPEMATAILPPSWRGGWLAVGLVDAEEEMAAATRSRSTPGGVALAPTSTAVRDDGPTTKGPRAGRTPGGAWIRGPRSGRGPMG